MNRPRFSSFLVIIGTGMLLLLLAQVYYLTELVRLQKIDFNKQINNTLESSLSAERQWRTDSLCKAMRRWINDSSLIRIYSRPNSINNGMNYILEDVRGPNPQSTSFSLAFEKRPIVGSNDPVRTVVMETVISNFRQSYISYQSVFYYTKSLGDSTNALNDALRLDSSFLQAILIKALRSKNINISFKLNYLSELDSTGIQRHSLLATDPWSLQTRLFRSDMFKNSNQKLVFASFDKPSLWLFQGLIWPIIISFSIFLLIAALFYYFYRALAQQKKLATLKSDFVDNMTHELKTPISIISAAAEALQDFGVNTDQIKSDKYLTNIRGQAKQLNNIVSKVLAISAFDKKEFNLSKSKFSMNELLEEIKGGFDPFLENCRFTICTPEKDLFLSGDRFHLKNLFFNIIDNAIKYNDKANIEVEVAYQTGAEIQTIRVKDNGQGIPREHIDNVFNKFYRVPSGNVQKTRGFGLGLFYVKKIVEAHNGRVMIESTPGKQTVIVLSFPNI